MKDAAHAQGIVGFVFGTVGNGIIEWTQTIRAIPFPFGRVVVYEVSKYFSQWLSWLGTGYRVFCLLHSCQRVFSDSDNEKSFVSLLETVPQRHPERSEGSKATSWGKDGQEILPFASFEAQGTPEKASLLRITGLQRSLFGRRKDWSLPPTIPQTDRSVKHGMIRERRENGFRTDHGWVGLGEGGVRRVIVKVPCRLLRARSRWIAALISPKCVKA